MKNERKTLDNLLQKINTRDPFHVQIPVKNKLVFNKIAPYVFLYNADEKKDPMLSELVKSEYTYFLIRDKNFDFSFWLPPILEKLVEAFGSCLVVEAWTASDTQEDDVHIHVSRKNALAIGQYLNKQLQAEGVLSAVKLITGSKKNFPTKAAPFIGLYDKKDNQILHLGLSIRPNYLLTEKNTIL